MSKLPAARRVEVDGTEMVALELREYQQLRGYRRQVGAQSVRLRELRRDLELLTAYLDDLARRAQALPDCPDCPGQECPGAAPAAPSGNCLPRSLIAQPASAGDRRKTYFPRRLPDSAPGRCLDQAPSPGLPG